MDLISETKNRFTFAAGYELAVVDMGGEGVRLELSHRYEGNGAIILPPEVAEELGRWLLSSLGQTVSKLPNRLEETLKRILVGKRFEPGDKNRLRETINVLKTYVKENG